MDYNGLQLLELEQPGIFHGHCEGNVSVRPRTTKLQASVNPRLLIGWMPSLPSSSCHSSDPILHTGKDLLVVIVVVGAAQEAASLRRGSLPTWRTSKPIEKCRPVCLIGSLTSYFFPQYSRLGCWILDRVKKWQNERKVLVFQKELVSGMASTKGWPVLLPAARYEHAGLHVHFVLPSSSWEKAPRSIKAPEKHWNMGYWGHWVHLNHLRPFGGRLEAKEA